MSYILGGPGNLIEYVPGDLVIFTGYLYTPDYVYLEQFEANHPNVGIVLGSCSPSYYENVLYRVYWLKTGRVTEVGATHLRLAYIDENERQ